MPQLLSDPKVVPRIVAAIDRFESERGYLCNEAPQCGHVEVIAVEGVASRLLFSSSLDLESSSNYPLEYMGKLMEAAKLLPGGET